MIRDQCQVNGCVVVKPTFPQAGMQLLAEHSVQRPLHTYPVWQGFRQYFAHPIPGGRVLQLLTRRFNTQALYIGISQRINDVFRRDARVLQIK